jgi:proteic killer suppression protein
VSKVVISRAVEKALPKLPRQVQVKLSAWVDAVIADGLPKVQTHPSYNDEKLAGKRLGQHSFRLNQAYRGFYTVGKNGEIQVVTVIEVNKHEY